MYDILLVIQTIVVICLIGIILIQRSDSDGFGTGTGGGGNQFMTGRASANLLTRTTAILATLFIVISLTLAYMSSNRGGGSIVDMVGESPATQQTAVPTPDAAAPAEVPKPEAKEPTVPKPE